MRSSKRPGLIAVLLAGFVGSSMFVFAPSQADIAHFRDARNENSTTLDIESVKVNNATRHRGKIIVTVHQDELIAGDEVSIYVDTRPRNAGPEYLYGGFAESEYWVWRTPNWRARGRKISWRCADVVASTKQDWTRVLFSR